MTSVFVDTGAFVGRVLVRDQHNHASRRGWDMLEELDVRLYSSEHVLVEAVSLLGRQAGLQLAGRWAREHLASKEIHWLKTTDDDWHEALRFLDKFSDQMLSCTDCLSFALMRREGIESAFGFDHHFERVGFQLWPAPSP